VAAVSLVLTRLSPLRPWIPPTVRRNAAIDITAAAFFGIWGGLTTPFISFMGRRLGASPLEVSVLVAAQAVVLLLSLWAVNVVRIGHPVRVVVIPSLVARSLFLVMPLVRTPEEYVALIVVHFAIGQLGSLGYVQVMRSVYPDDLRGRIMAVVRVGMALCWIAASLVGGRLMQLIDFRWVFASAAVFGVTSSLVFSRIRLPAVPEPEERADLRHMGRILRDDPGYRRFLTGLFIYGFSTWFYGPAIAILLVDVLRATSFQAGLLGAVASGTWLFSYYYWGRMIDRRSAALAMSRVVFIGSLTPLVYLAARDGWMVQGAGVTEGMTSAGFDIGWIAVVLQYAPADHIRHYVAIFNFFVGLRAGTAPFLAGLLIPLLGVRWIFAIAAAGTLAGALLMGTAVRRAPASAA
jgi:predicted MFS family arabinose efflux permease